MKYNVFLEPSNKEEKGGEPHTNSEYTQPPVSNNTHTHTQRKQHPQRATHSSGKRTSSESERPSDTITQTNTPPQDSILKDAPHHPERSSGKKVAVLLLGCVVKQVSVNVKARDRCRSKLSTKLLK